MRTMIRGMLFVAAAVCIAGVVSAQPALERLEKKQFRDEKAGAKEQVGAAAKKPERGYLGVITDDKKDRGRGVRVVKTVSGSPAEKAGIQAGDLITAIRDKPVRQMSDVPQAMAGAVPGSVLGITVIRQGEARTIHVTLGRRPADPQLPPPPVEDVPAAKKIPPPPKQFENAGPPLLGVITRSYVDDPRFALGRPPIQGVLIVEVVAHSPAAAAELRPGDIIVAADGRVTRDRRDLTGVISVRRPGQQVELTFYRGRLLIKQKVRLAAADSLQNPPPARPEPETLPPGRPSDRLRMEALERRVQELEQRLAELEKKLEAGR